MSFNFFKRIGSEVLNANLPVPSTELSVRDERTQVTRVEAKINPYFLVI